MLLTAEYVLPVTQPHIEKGAVLVRDDKIVDVGPAQDLKKKYPNEAVRDFGRAALLPGFVDTHTHLEYSAMRGLVNDLPYARWKNHLLHKESLFSTQDWDDSALLGALEAVASGITTIADITHTGASGHAANAAGLRGIIYREVSTMDKHAVDDVMSAALRDIKDWAATSDSTRLSFGIAPHAPYSCHPELFRRVGELGLEGMPIAIHLAGSKEEYSFVKYGSSLLATDVREAFDKEAPLWLPTGVSPVRYVLQWGLFDAPNVLAIHCTQVDDDDIEVLAEYDIAVSHCPRCNAKLGMGVAPVVAFLEKGIRVGLGTDSPAASNSMDPFEEMRTGLLVQRAHLGSSGFLEAPQLMRMATIEAARALGVDDRVGSLDPGKQADIIAVNLSNSHQVPTHHPNSAIIHSANQDSILFTMVGGNILYDNGHKSGIDRERLGARIEEMRVKLRS